MNLNVRIKLPRCPHEVQQEQWRMSSSGMWRSVGLVRTDVSEERVASETSVLTRLTWRQILEDGILHSHRRENIKSYTGTMEYVKTKP
jgi:hypothetical protein